ncbi:OpgC domain-containing protein [Pseudoalteromonas sp. NZS127_1]|uniref:OpgC domain-containing protein n=1 Tax=Pseudoalteromonas sp. NZS127_1 TaxID=2792074 RepID=UPI0018CC90DA|nr:OpgC domain-containing protein [Pseudoalteromonas sp. NZS127_1]MBG9994556.1 OpgC domain-containing protein [Pseudoalteromonas sp. NZS127_1]
MSEVKNQKRIFGIDLARGIAIFLAMTSHTFTSLNFYPIMEINLLFRSATPLFIVVLGFFLYFSYFAKIDRKGFKFVRGKLWEKALKCYLYYLFSCAVWVFFSDFSLLYFFRLGLLLSGTPFTDILKFYAVVLFVSPYLLMLLRSERYILLAFIILTPHILTFYGLLPSLSFLPYGEYISAMLYGGSDVIAGPSVLHSLFFVFIGILLAKNFNGDSLFGSNSHILAIFVFLLSLFFYLPVSLKELATMELRNKNFLEYFIYGSITSILIIELSLFTAKYMAKRYFQPFLTLSKSSLILFCYGNSFLYIIYQNFSFTPVRFFFIFLFFYLLCKFNVYLKGEVKGMRSRFN